MATKITVPDIGYFETDYDVNEIYGCTDEVACNFNQDATVDDNSCIYPEEYPDNILDCEGNCIEGLLIGDINLDDVINVVDIVTLVNAILSEIGNNFLCQGDLNEDGTINIIDVIWIVTIVLAGY